MAGRSGDGSAKGGQNPGRQVEGQVARAAKALKTGRGPAPGYVAARGRSGTRGNATGGSGTSGDAARWLGNERGRIKRFENSGTYLASGTYVAGGN